MNEKEKLLREVDELTLRELRLLRNLLKSVRKGKGGLKQAGKKNEAYLDVRKALKGIKGSLSADISSQREDRL